MFGEKGTATDVVATLEFEASHACALGRRFDASGKTSFITAFYCSPAGLNLTFKAPCAVINTACPAQACSAPYLHSQTAQGHPIGAQSVAALHGKSYADEGLSKQHDRTSVTATRSPLCAAVQGLERRVSSLAMHATLPLGFTLRTGFSTSSSINSWTRSDLPSLHLIGIVLMDSAQFVQDGRDCRQSVGLPKCNTAAMSKQERVLCCCRIRTCWPPSRKVTLAAELAAHAAVSNSSEASEAVSSSSSNGQGGAASSGHPTGATGLTRRRIFCHRWGLPLIATNHRC